MKKMERGAKYIETTILLFLSHSPCHSPPVVQDSHKVSHPLITQNGAETITQLQNELTTDTQKTGERSKGRAPAVRDMWNANIILRCTWYMWLDGTVGNRRTHGRD